MPRRVSLQKLECLVWYNTLTCPRLGSQAEEVRTAASFLPPPSFIFYPLSSHDVRLLQGQGQRRLRERAEKIEQGAGIEVLCLAGGFSHCSSHLHLSDPVSHTSILSPSPYSQGPLSGSLSVSPEPFLTWLEVRRKHMALLCNHKPHRTRAEIGAGLLFQWVSERPAVPRCLCLFF